MINFLLWILMGAIAGWLAGLIMKTDYGLLGNIIVGIVGGFIGGLVMNLIHKPSGGGFNLYSLLVSILGAVILLAIVKAVRK